MEMDELNTYQADYKRVDAVLRRNEMIMPYTAENVSRDRLMRTKVGIYHLLTNVMPGMENTEDQKEIYLWLNGIYSILRIEEVDFLKDISKVIK